MDTADQNCEIKPRPLFDEVIERFNYLVDAEIELTNRIYRKTIKIANTDRGLLVDNEKDYKSFSIIENLNLIMDRLAENQDVLKIVAQDLEKAIN